MHTHTYTYTYIYISYYIHTFIHTSAFIHGTHGMLTQGTLFYPDPCKPFTNVTSRFRWSRVERPCRCKTPKASRPFFEAIFAAMDAVPGKQKLRVKELFESCASAEGS